NPWSLVACPSHSSSLPVALPILVLAIVVTTGIASIFLTKDYTPDYNSGLAHAIFYALTAYPVIEERHLHGEVGAFGILIALLVGIGAAHVRTPGTCPYRMPAATV